MVATATLPDVEALTAAVEREAAVYGALLRLSTRQRRYMVRRDARRLEGIASAITHRIEDARAATSERTRMLGEVAAALGMAPQAVELQSLTPLADTPVRERLEAALRCLASIAGRLYRRNFQNHQLARFSLDLVGEEQAVLLGAQPEEPRYERTGETHRTDVRGAVDGRA